MKLPETRATPWALQALERLQNCAPEDRASQEAEVRRHLSLVSELASAEANHKIGQAISSGAAQRPNKELSLRSVLSCSMLLPTCCARPT